MAYADGMIHENEIAVLAELAGNLGLDADVASEIIQQAPSLDFRVPEKAEDCRHELHRVVLMMVTDGTIHEREYLLCQKLAEAMQIDLDYLEKVVEFYLAKQQEHIQHLAIFQNLFLVAIADGALTPVEEEFLYDVADNLGLGDDDVVYLIENHATLDFIIPEDEQEKLFTLKNLVYMMLVDGEIEPSEYELCLTFAKRVGMGRKEIEEILAEYAQMQVERSENQHEIDNRNVDICLDIFLNLDKVPLSVQEILTLGDNLLQTQELKSVNLAPIYTRYLLDFFWLVYIRASSLHREHKARLPLLLDIARSQNSFQVLRDHVISLEQEYGATEIPLPEMPDEVIQHDLKTYFERL